MCCGSLGRVLCMEHVPAAAVRPCCALCAHTQQRAGVPGADMALVVGVLHHSRRLSFLSAIWCRLLCRAVTASSWQQCSVCAV